MVGTAIVLQGLELLGWGSLYLKSKAVSDRRALIHSPSKYQAIPILDSQLKKLAGHPTQFEKQASQRVTKLVRGIANSIAFGHVVTALINSRSPIRKHAKKAPVITIF